MLFIHICSVIFWLAYAALQLKLQEDMFCKWVIFNGLQKPLHLTLSLKVAV